MKYFGHKNGAFKHALDLATAAVALHKVLADLKKCSNLGDVRAPYTDAILDLERRARTFLGRLDGEYCVAVGRYGNNTGCWGLINTDGSVEAAIAVLESRLAARK